MKIVNFGAGNIGKGLIGALLSNDGEDVVFLDTNQELVTSINLHNSYDIEIVGTSKELVNIKNVSAVDIIRENKKAINSIIETDLITTSVGTDNLEKIVPLLKEGLLERFKLGKKAIDIIPNENTINAGNLLRELVYKKLNDDEAKIFDEMVGFKNSAIDRQAIPIEYNGVMIPSVEEYFEWIIEDKNSINNNEFKINSASYVDNLEYFIKRKLFCVNAGHAAAAYLGYVKGFNTVQDSLADVEIRALVKGLVIENAWNLMREYQVGEDEVIELANIITNRHGNPLFKDPVERVGRNPLRKLGVGERLTSQLDSLYEQNKPIDNIVEVVGAALNFYNQNDVESEKMIKMLNENKIQEAIKKITGVKNEEIISLIVKKYEKYNRLEEN